MAMWEYILTIEILQTTAFNQATIERPPRYHFSTSKGDEFVNQNHGSGPTQVLHGNGNNFTIDNT